MGTPWCTFARTSASADSTTQLPEVVAGDLERLDDVDACGDERRERAREARDRHLQDDLADACGQAQLEAVPHLPAGRGLLPAPEPPDREAHRREEDEPVAAHEIGGGDDALREHRQVASEVGEDVLEDRDEEEEHPDQGQDREGENDERVDHRPAHAAADLHLLLDLDRDPVEDRVEDAGCLAGLDHRDVEAVEGVRMPRHRLREEHPALDVGAHLSDDRRQHLVVGLLLEDDERRDDVQTRVDHGRELPREDL